MARETPLIFTITFLSILLMIIIGVPSTKPKLRKCIWILSEPPSLLIVNSSQGDASDIGNLYPQINIYFDRDAKF